MTQEEIVLKIKVDKTDINNSLSSLTDKINELKDAQKKLNDEFEKSGDVEKYTTETKKLNDQLKTLYTDANNATKAIHAEKGSITEMTEALKLNRSAYNALSKEQRDNINIGGKLRKTIVEQQNSLNDLNRSVGKPGLRGGLSEAFSGMAKSIGTMGLAFISVQGIISAFKGIIAQSGEATDILEQQIAGLNGGLRQLGEQIINWDFANLWENIKKSSNNAIEVERALQDLADRRYVSSIRRKQIDLEITKIEKDLSDISKRDITISDDYIKKHEQLIELRKSSADILYKEAEAEYNLALSLVDKNGMLTESYKNMFETFKKSSPEVIAALQQVASAFNDIENPIPENIWTAVMESGASSKASDIGKELAKQGYGTGGVGFGVAVTDADKREKELQDQQIKNATLAKARLDASLLKLPDTMQATYRELFKTNPQLLKNLFDTYEKLQQAEINQLNTTIANNQAITNMEFKKKSEGKKGELKETKEFNEAKLALDEMFFNLETEVYESAEAERRRKITENFEKKAKLEKEQAYKLIADRIATDADYITAEEDGLKATVLIDEKYRELRVAQEAKWAEEDLKVIEERSKRKAEVLSESEKYVNEYNFMSRQLSLEAEWVKEEERLTQQAEEEKRRAQADQEIMLEELKSAQEAKLITMEEYAQKEKDIKKATADYEIEVEKDKNRRIWILKKEALAASASASVEFLSTLADVMNNIGELRKKDEDTAKQRRKAMLAVEAAAAIADIWINYSVASAKGFAQMGPILGIAPAAVMTAQAVASTALILAKTAVAYQGLASVPKEAGVGSTQGSNLGQKFADGGPVYGSSHSAGGVKIEAEGGEFVINKRAMRNPMVSVLASYLNKFGDGGPVIRDFPPLNDPINIPIGGPIIRDIPGIVMPTFSSEKLSPSSSLSISNTRGSGSFIARASYGSSYSGASSYTGGMSTMGTSGVSGLAAEVAAAIQAIPVYIVESEMTGMQRKVQVREQKFTI